MSPAHVLEPTYRRLKRSLMEGTWPIGQKLEAMRLAEEFGVSMTPVRDSLNQLVGEGLVDLTPGEGYRVTLLTEQSLRDMLAVNVLLLGSVVDLLPQKIDRDDLAAPINTYADRVGDVFSIFAFGSENKFLRQTVDLISDRLHTVRRLEPDVLPNALDALAELESNALATPSKRVQALRRYHDQCMENVSRLISMLAEQGSP
ncbi:MAG: GntR family transcriptional regulator [Allopontixanthobacter sediminis]